VINNKIHVKFFHTTKIENMYFWKLNKLINEGENPSVDVLIGQIDEFADFLVAASVKQSQLDAVQHQRRAFVALRN